MFEGLNESEKAEIISEFSEVKSYRAGEIIYSAQSFFNAVCFIVSGEAFAETDNSGRLRMNTFKSGTCFGAAAVFGGGDRYVSTVTAKTDVEVVFLTECRLKEIFLKYPVTALSYIEFLSDRIRFLNAKFGVISSPSAEDTVYNYLLTLETDGYARLPVGMTALSKMLGLGRATLYRSFDALEREHKIERENDIIRVIKK